MPIRVSRNRYYIEEKNGNIDYLGWVGKQDRDNGDDVNLVSVAFAGADDDPEVETKPMSTSKRGRCFCVSVSVSLRD